MFKLNCHPNSHTEYSCSAMLVPLTLVEDNRFCFLFTQLASSDRRTQASFEQSVCTYSIDSVNQRGGWVHPSRIKRYWGWNGIFNWLGLQCHVRAPTGPVLSQWHCPTIRGRGIRHKCMSLYVTWNDGIMGGSIKWSRIQAFLKLNPLTTLYLHFRQVWVSSCDISFVFSKHWRRDVLECIMFCQTWSFIFYYILSSALH